MGFSLVVTNFSGSQFLGLSGAGYDFGIAVWNFEWMATLTLALFAVLILLGILARDVFPDLSNPDLAWPSLIFEDMPV